ncbi:response regulator [Phenylobacterium terrae]|uniref:Response regulator n=1 Tax=Phenylobacterium terrae TaxID=2665495 RepID=A0ABW4MZ37_9CAUL
MLHDVRILIVDDHRNMRTLIKAALYGLGFSKLFEAADGRHALEVMSEARPDLVITDFKMPEMNGLDFVTELRRDAANPFTEVPVIMLTGHTDLHVVRACLRAGVNEFLAKPFTAQALLDRIRRCAEEDRPFIRSAAYTGPWPRMSQVEGLSEAS